MKPHARIMIDSKEGVIEIQGPLEFVAKYMERYAPGVKQEKTAPAILTPKPLSSKRLCVKTLRALIRENFFAQGRPFGDIKAACISKGARCSDQSLRNALKEMQAKHKLNKNGAGRATSYALAVAKPKPTSEGAIDIPL